MRERTPLSPFHALLVISVLAVATPRSAHATSLSRVTVAKTVATTAVPMIALDSVTSLTNPSTIAIIEFLKIVISGIMGCIGLPRSSLAAVLAGSDHSCNASPVYRIGHQQGGLVGKAEGVAMIL